MRSIPALPKFRHLPPTFCDTSDPAANSLEPDLSLPTCAADLKTIYLSRRCREERDPAQGYDLGHIGKQSNRSAAFLGSIPHDAMPPDTTLY